MINHRVNVDIRIKQVAASEIPEQSYLIFCLDTILKTRCFNIP